jgi:hypothetical protein
MPKPEISEFARILIQEVRDRAVHACDLQLGPAAKGPVAERWRKAMTTSGGIPPEILIPDCVDQVLFRLLDAIDNGLLKLQFGHSGERVVDLTEEGDSEMAGWYMGSGGWRAMYSKERFVDDFADLA